MFYKIIIQPFLFRIDAEKVHHKVAKWMRSTLSIPLFRNLVRKYYVVEHPSLKKTLFGLEFKNPIGLAAGFDKDATMYNDLACLGFGFIEVGTVTPKAQEGNPQPRLFRLPQDKALINRMGFNNAGLDATIERLKQGKKDKELILGGNIGKNKTTPNEQAISDYLASFHALFEYVDYFVVNVSSPNTPNLRELQEKEPLKALLNSLQEENMKKAQLKPILLKIAPDLTNHQLDDIVEIVEATNLDGIIATNTTIERSGLNTPASEVKSIGAGGLSGLPVRSRSTEVIRYLAEKSKHKIPIVAVGGVFTVEDVIEKIDAGAALVQVYTGFIYEGPAMIRKINKKLIQHYGKASR